VGRDHRRASQEALDGGTGMETRRRIRVRSWRNEVDPTMHSVSAPHGGSIVWS
jgi:hypothetical protein